MVNILCLDLGVQQQGMAVLAAQWWVAERTSSCTLQLQHMSCMPVQFMQDAAGGRAALQEPFCWDSLHACIPTGAPAGACVPNCSTLPPPKLPALPIIAVLTVSTLIITAGALVNAQATTCGPT
jgi:hypothetical protein